MRHLLAVSVSVLALAACAPAAPPAAEVEVEAAPPAASIEPAAAPAALDIGLDAGTPAPSTELIRADGTPAKLTDLAGT